MVPVCTDTRLRITIQDVQILRHYGSQIGVQFIWTSLHVRSNNPTQISLM